MDYICNKCCKFSVCDDKVDISSSEDEFNYVPGPGATCSEAFEIEMDLNLSNYEAIAELKQLEFYGRPFDNTPDASNKANRKIAAVVKAIEALQKLDHIQYILNYGVSK